MRAMATTGMAGTVTICMDRDMAETGMGGTAMGIEIMTGGTADRRRPAARRSARP